MILDASAVLAVFFDEIHSAWVVQRLLDAGPGALRMSLINLAEVRMVVERKRRGADKIVLANLQRDGVHFLADTLATCDTAVNAKARFSLNFGDCFAYAHAKLLDEPLLTLDADFLKTDLREVLHPGGH